MALVAVAFAFAVGASTSLASVSHAFSGTFGAALSSPANPYPLLNPTDAEVDQSNGDVYVTDPSNHRVEKFDSAGNLILMFGRDVDQTTGGDVCTIASGDVCKAGTSGSGSGQLENPAYLAVDNSGGPSTGDIYVGDTGDNLVTKFDATGHVISSWGVGGQKDGSDASDLPVYGPLYGVAVGGPDGDFYVGGTHYSDNVWQYSQDGTYEGPYQNTTSTPWLKADAEKNLYYSAPAEGFFSPPTIWQANLNAGAHGQYTYYQLGTATPLTGFNFDPGTHDFYQDTGTEVAHYDSDCNPTTGPCDPVDSFGSGHLFEPEGVAVDASTHTVYVVNSSTGDVAAFADVRPIVNTEPASEVTDHTVTLNGTVEPAGRGAINSCKFQYGFDKSYGQSLPCTPDPAASNFTGTTHVTAVVTGLSPGTKDHYRLVAGNVNGGSTNGSDGVFVTTAAPAIDGLAAEHLDATSAELIAQINANGLPTTYRFQYGSTIEYGQEIVGTIPASNTDQPVSVHLTGLTPQVVYHYRLIAENAFENQTTQLTEGGETISEDHTFNFFPPPCPNQNVRQQTQSNYLPDCRAYELVSPSDAGGTQLYSAGPNTGYATSPPRFSFTGLFSAIPNSGGSPIDGNGDLYVATRTATGWVTRYVGLPSQRAAVDGGPPQGLPGQGGSGFLGNRTSVSNGSSAPDIIQNNVLTDPEMNRFLDWDDGGQGGDNPTPISSNAPYVWSAAGDFLDRWPTDLATVPGGAYQLDEQVYSNSHEGPLTSSPGGKHALDCPSVKEGNSFQLNDCPGEVNASSDLSHFVFSSGWNVFAPGGQLGVPGSVYDNNTVTGTVSVASKTPNGEEIPSEPGDASPDFLRIPAISSNGSHILIASDATGPCGLAHCGVPPCGNTFGGKIPCPKQPAHLYMRINDTVTDDVSQGHDVNFVGMTEDGTKVYFTSLERLTPEDTDSSTDLYMWSEETNSIKLISLGSGGSGNSDACDANFTSNCGVVPFSNLSYCQLISGFGGNCRSDNSIAATTGDIYFYSPELLDGSRGIPNKENLYVYREGHVQYVTTLTTGKYCYRTELYSTSSCGVPSEGPIVRMQVTPDDSYMAFLTASPVTQYNNNGYLEMYVFKPSTGVVTCVSCIPSGALPTSNVAASQDGLFLTEDGRSFFTTDDALVHTDTNEGQDVYEYVDGRPQLITPGTGDTTQSRGEGENEPGLDGVSANGADVYFSTYQTLVPEDHNGLFLKFYDARAGGGFSEPPAPPPCAAADECHGTGSSSPSPVVNATGVSIAGGNVTASGGGHHKPAAKRHHRRKRRKVSHRSHRRRSSFAPHGGGN